MWVMHSAGGEWGIGVFHTGSRSPQSRPPSRPPPAGGRNEKVIPRWGRNGKMIPSLGEEWEGDSLAGGRQTPAPSGGGLEWG